MMLFDTHAHVLSPDRDKYPYSSLRGGETPPVSPVIFPVEELLEQMDAGGVAHACLVQRATLYGYDNSYTLDGAAQNAARLAPVIVLDAEDPGSPAKLRDLAGRQPLGGLRMVAPRLTRADTSWLNSDTALGLWAAAADLGLPVAVILYRLNNEAGRAAMAQVARQFTTIPILLDHCGMPHASTPETRWAQGQGIDYAIPAGVDFGVADHLGAFDDLGHVHFKVTDINFDRLEDAALDSAAFLQVLAKRFGAKRLVWGSDVGQSPKPYADKIARLRASARLLDLREQAAYLGGNGHIIYGAGLAGGPS